MRVEGRNRGWTAVVVALFVGLVASSCTTLTWGANFGGQLGFGDTTERSTPTRLDAATQGNWVEVAGGSGHSCGRRADGTVWCWGINFAGQLGTGDTSDRVEPAQAGTQSDWTRVVGGGDHSCGLRAGRTIWCWGTNFAGQLGDGTTSDRSTPSQVAAGTATWIDLSAGLMHTCAIRAGNELFCWGDNSAGQLGDGTTTGRSAPVQVPGSWVSVSAGGFHTCAIATDATLHCWGSNDSGQVGDGTTTNRLSPVVVPSGVDTALIASGFTHTCATGVDGSLRCWGANDSGQLGDGTATNRLLPVQVGAATDWDGVAAGGRHTCGVRNRTGWCWGTNDAGQLGDETTSARFSPVPMTVPAPGANFQPILGLGFSHTCRIRRDRTLWCWGRNTFGQVGDGTTTDRLSQVQVGTATDWEQVSAGLQHTCAVRTSGSLWCWGLNQFDGQVGDGTRIDRHSPVQVGTATDWEQVSAAQAHTCAVRSSGSLWCWGDNNVGQLGDGTFGSDRLSPVRVGTASDWQQVGAGGVHTCGRRAPGSLWCWGLNNDGQVGDGTFGGIRLSPVRVGTASDWQQVDAGQVHTCGVRSPGSLWCWGDNGSGQVGDGAVGTSRSAPVQIGTATNWTEVTGGNLHTCALGGGLFALWCWGGNGSGQLGDGTTTDRSTPAQVGAGAFWLQVDAGATHTAGIVL